MDKLLIRRMETADIAAVQEMARKYLGEDAWSQAGFQADVENPHAIPLVALQGNKLLGFLCAQVVYDEGTLLLLATCADCRKQGIASALFREMLLAGSAAARFTLEVRVSNAPAIAFYEKQGFVRVGIRKNFYTHPAEDALIYLIKTDDDGKE